MPRVKQSPRKNPRDIPNPTNWASILRNNHHKYFYLTSCGRMRSDSCILRLDGYILWSDGIKPLILRTCSLLYIIDLFNFAIGCGGTVTCCGGMDTYCGGMVTCCGGTVNSMVLISLFSYSC